MTKKHVLTVSLSSAALASLIAICTTVAADSPNTATRAMAVAGFVGLLSVGSFFVGLAFPKEIV